MMLVRMCTYTSICTYMYIPCWCTSAKDLVVHSPGLEWSLGGEPGRLWARDCVEEEVCSRSCLKFKVAIASARLREGEFCELTSTYMYCYKNQPLATEHIRRETGS